MLPENGHENFVAAGTPQSVALQPGLIDEYQACRLTACPGSRDAAPGATRQVRIRIESLMIEFKSYMLPGDSGILVLELTGSLNTDNSEYLMDCVQGHIEDGIGNIILNCADLDFISSMGLGTLIRAMARLKKQGGAIAVAGARGGVADVLSLMHLNRLLSIYDDVDEAAAALAAEQ